MYYCIIIVFIYYFESPLLTSINKKSLCKLLCSGISLSPACDPPSLSNETKSLKISFHCSAYIPRFRHLFSCWYSEALRLKKISIKDLFPFGLRQENIAEAGAVTWSTQPHREPGHFRQREPGPNLTASLFTSGVATLA